MVGSVSNPTSLSQWTNWHLHYSTLHNHGVALAIGINTRDKSPCPCKRKLQYSHSCNALTRDIVMMTSILSILSTFVFTNTFIRKLTFHLGANLNILKYCTNIWERTQLFMSNMWLVYHETINHLWVFLLNKIQILNLNNPLPTVVN